LNEIAGMHRDRRLFHTYTRSKQMLKCTGAVSLFIFSM